MNNIFDFLCFDKILCFLVSFLFDYDRLSKNVVLLVVERKKHLRVKI